MPLSSNRPLRSMHRWHRNPTYSRILGNGFYGQINFDVSPFCSSFWIGSYGQFDLDTSPLANIFGLALTVISIPISQIYQTFPYLLLRSWKFRHLLYFRKSYWIDRCGQLNLDIFICATLLGLASTVNSTWITLCAAFLRLAPTVNSKWHLCFYDSIWIGSYGHFILDWLLRSITLNTYTSATVFWIDSYSRFGFNTLPERLLTNWLLRSIRRKFLMLHHSSCSRSALAVDLMQAIHPARVLHPVNYCGWYDASFSYCATAHALDQP